MDTHPTESEGRMRRGRGAIHARVTRKTVFALLAVVCALLFTAIPSPQPDRLQRRPCRPPLIHADQRSSFPGHRQRVWGRELHPRRPGAATAVRQDDSGHPWASGLPG